MIDRWHRHLFIGANNPVHQVMIVETVRMQMSLPLVAVDTDYIGKARIGHRSLDGGAAFRPLLSRLQCFLDHGPTVATSN